MEIKNGIMEIKDIIQGRRSIRAYLPDPVSKDQLQSLILEAGIWAPSAGNAQTWRFLVVTDQSLLRKVELVSPGLSGAPPALIVICQDLEESRIKGGTLGPQLLSIADAAMAAQNIMLYAHALGLGTCVIASFHREALQAVLNLPEYLVPIFIVAVGYPKIIPRAPLRKKDVIWINEYR